MCYSKKANILTSAINVKTNKKIKHPQTIKTIASIDIVMLGIKIFKVPHHMNELSSAFQ